MRCLNYRDLLTTVVCTVVFVSTFSCPVHSKSYDDIYLKVFGRKPEKQYFPQQMGLIVDDTYVGQDIAVSVPSTGSDYKIAGYALLNHLKTVQKYGTVRDLALKIDKQGMLRTEDIQSLGYKVVVDRRAFIVNIEIPAEFRRITTIYVMGEPEPVTLGAANKLRKPASLSAYLNYGFGFNYISSYDESDSGLESPMASFYGKARMNDYISNYSGSVDPASDTVLNMSNLNVERFFGKENRKYTFGQVSPLTKGFQSSADLLGVGYTSGPVMNALGRYNPDFSHIIDLDKDSLLEIHINYNKVKEIELPGGVYHLKGFPLRNGFNIVKIVKVTEYTRALPKKDDLFSKKMGYERIEKGLLIKSTATTKENYHDQAIRLHQDRVKSSEWFLSDKIPRHGQTISEDADSITEVVKTEFVFPFAVDPVLYDPQYFEWNYSVGYPLSWNGVTPQTSDNMTHSLYMKKGVNRFITSTLYTQVNNSQLLLGNESYISLPFGPFSINNAIRKTAEIPDLGLSTKFSFMTYSIYSNPEHFFQLLSLGFSYGLSNRSFIPFGVTRPVGLDAAMEKISFSVSYRIKYLFSSTIQYSQNIARAGDPEGNSKQFNFVLQRNLPFDFNFSSTYQRNVGKDVVDPNIITFKLSWSGLDSFGISSTYKDTVVTQNVTTDVGFQNSFLDNSVNTNSTIKISDEATQFNTNFQFGSQIGSYGYSDSAIQTDQQFSYIQNSQRINSNTGLLLRTIDGGDINMVSFSAESGFVYADNIFAISTPVQDSFAIFAKDYSLKDDLVFVGDDGRKIDWLGPTVLPSLRDRTFTDVMVDVPSLPLGSELERMHAFEPVHFTGYLVELHVTPSVMLMAKLLKPNKKAAKYLKGHVESPTDPTFKERFITSRSGIFQVSNLKPGNYFLTFGRKPYEKLSITIPSDANGLYRKGNIDLVKKGDVKKSEEKTALEEEIASIKAKKKEAKKDAPDEKDLLKQLIEDILNETIADNIDEEEEVAVEEAVEFVDDLGSGIELNYIIRQIDEPDMTTFSKAEYLHEIKKQVNRYIDKFDEGGVTSKDSLEILRKINDYYLRTYEFKQRTNTLYKQQLRTTSEEAFLLHKKRQKLSIKNQQKISSPSIEKAREIHRKRQQSK